MSTAPWAARAAVDTLASALTVVSEVVVDHPAAGRVPLDIDSGTLTYDEDTAPTVQLRAAAAATDAALAAIDARMSPRVLVSAGYVYPGGVRDVHQVAALVMDGPMTRRPDARVELDAYCDELLVQRAGLWSGTLSITPGMQYAPALRAILAVAVGQDASTAAHIDPAVQSRVVLAADADPITVDPDTDLWSLVQDLSDRVGARCWHDGNGDWWATVQDATDPTPAAALTTGPAGLVTMTEVGYDLTRWANAVAVIYRWRDATGTARQVIGRAQVLTGPLGVTTIGRHLLRVVYDHPSSQAAADVAAQTIVKRAVTRGRTSGLASARALWWLRPGDTVAVHTPDDTGLLTVARVTFDLADHAMTVTARIPDPTPATPGA